jgi:very-short-patch-repair endonuclease
MAGSPFVVAQLRRWAEELVDLSRRNRLLYFKHTRSASLQFDQDGSAVEVGLAGSGWGFFLPKPPPSDPDEEHDRGMPRGDELIISITPERFGPEIERGLSNLARRSQAEFLDSGLWVLYLGLGQLRWKDVDDKDAASPLLLIPVELSRSDGSRAWRMTLSENGESAINPALSVKLESDFGIELPAIDDLDDDDLDSVLAAVERVVKGNGWRVEPTAVLTTFTFQKEVIYRDLRQNETLIAEHDLVKLLAEGPTSDVAGALDFVPDPEDTLDERHPPEELTCVMDADASQRQCILAARAGRSFVMDGPPGTGKSQTITNIIAQLMADGKTVLFVSEKAAALEVVQRRLADLKLDPFVLALHSRTATRKAVAQELGAALRERPRSRSLLAPTDLAQLRDQRRQLTAYAIAVNRVRQPLDRSLHDAVGRASQLDHLPKTPVPSPDLSTLTPKEFTHLRSTAEQLGRSWNVVERGDSFLWRDLVNPAAGAAREAGLRDAVERCSEVMVAVEATAVNVVDELRLAQRVEPASIDHLVTLLRLVDVRPSTSWRLLSVEDFNQTRSDARVLAGAMVAQKAAEDRLASLIPKWADLEETIGSELREASASLLGSTPPIPLMGIWTNTELSSLLDLLSRLKVESEALAEPLGILRSSFGARSVGSFSQAARLAGLASLAGSVAPPEAAWLNPVVRPALDEARRVLGAMLETFRSRRDSLATTFKPDVLDLDLKTLRARFEEVHKGLRKLGGSYRTDKKLLASKTVTGKVTGETLAKLDEAVEWQELAERLSAAETRYGPTLGGHYYSTRDSADFDDIERSIGLADQALELAAGDMDQASLEQQIALGGTPDPRLPQAAADIERHLTCVNELLQDDSIQTIAFLLRGIPVDQISAWADDARTELETAARVLAEISGPTGTVAEAQEVGELVEVQTQSAIDIAGYQQALSEILTEFGPGEPGPDALISAIEWSEQIRDHHQSALDEPTAQALSQTDLTSYDLAHLQAELDKLLQAVLHQFNDSYAAELRRDIEASFADGNELLGDLGRTVSDVAEWESYVTARDVLAARGWHEVAEACVAQRVPANEVADIIERAVLQRWCDQQIDSDPDLKPKRALDRDAILAQFRAIDDDLVQRTAASVINACADRRPNSLVGPAGVINQQAQLKRRHKPVRQLLAEAGDVAQRLKPCFMMSPLSVSQFLPPGLGFDVVIFDEASQVKEADAICCLYRGTQLIVAGDQKQLPPTSFFDRMADDDEDLDDDILDFESVLDRCKAQGFPGLPLNWHYRSQHESLIAFSNRSFYDGRLSTFPGAVFESPSLGVELFRVDGVYHRGGTRDNPIEAEKVVDRVVHHRRAHPSMTIGVVALSVAQQVAIETAIERRSLLEPELAELISNDRLDGFFVKNLENVQGDERDLIIMSIGYGPDEMGKFLMNFGPMNRPGGERRLNVAVTRARRRVEVVASFGSGQITSENGTIQHLRRYLDFADRGIAALAIEVGEEGRDTESPFEDEVVRSVRMLGYEPVPQVGVAGYRVDIGVRHPNQPGTYLIGIECDGATYHSSKVARDRDRLRQQVLEGLGWKIHRIWSTAWFSDRAGEEERLRRAFENALAVVDVPIVTRPAAADVDVYVDEHDFDQRPPWVEDYQPPEASEPLLNLEFTDPRSRPEISRQILEVVRMSGPISADDVLDAVRAAWGLGRAGARIREAFSKALSALKTKGDVTIVKGFVSRPTAEIVVRVPNEDPASIRKVASVDPRELDLAVVSLLSDASGASPAELRLAWARLFGWRRVGAEIETAFEQSIRRLKRSRTVIGGDRLQVATE